MANFIVTYDLNGPRPTHAEMDDHLSSLGIGSTRGRLLETAWYIQCGMSCPQLRDYIARILGPEDLLLVAETAMVAWQKLLVDTNGFKASFEAG